MTDSAYKTKILAGLDPATPAPGGLAPYTRARWAPLRALFAAQDTIPATSRRTLAEVGLSGAAAWAQPTGLDPDGGPFDAQNYPDGSWRTIATSLANLTPGCELRADVLACPSGLVVKEVAGDWVSDGAWAELRVRVTWTNGGNTSGPHDWVTTIPGSSAGDWGGDEEDADGANWSRLIERQILEIRPQGYDTDPAVQAAYSEWSTVEIAIAVRGGMRLVHAQVYEHPLVHTTAHDRSGLTSVHAVPPGAVPLVSRPVAKAPDGATYEEHRFGTRRMAQVAERQSERLGPRILSWSSYSEATHDPLTETEAAPVTVTSTSYVDLLDPTSTSYDAAGPGFAVAGAHAQLHRLAGPYIAGGRFGVVPVRVSVDASCTSTGGRVRVQCGSGYVEVAVTGARGWYTATGHLQSQVFPDDADAPPMVLRGSSSSGAQTLSVWNVSIDFGTWA